MEKQKTILFVDDDPAMLNALRRAFYDEPYETLFTTSGEEALHLMQGQAVDVVVSDMRMPGMGGQALLAALQEQYPQVTRILFSGQPSIAQGEITKLVQTLNHGDVFRFIGKTVNMNADVKNAIHEAIGSR